MDNRTYLKNSHSSRFKLASEFATAVEVSGVGVEDAGDAAASPIKLFLVKFGQNFGHFEQNLDKIWANFSKFGQN